MQKLYSMTTKSKKILGMGNALVDVIIPLKNDHQLQLLNLPKGSMQLVDTETANHVLDFFKETTPSIACGGSAANTISGLANLGAETGFIGMVGNDFYGEKLRSEQLKANIKPHLFTSDHPTGKAITLMSPDTERTFATYLGAALGLTMDAISDELFEGYDIFHIEGYLVQNYDLIRGSIEKAKAKGLKISLDMSSYNVVEDNLDFLKEMLYSYIDIAFFNEEEALAFTGKGPEESIDIIGERCEYVVVKAGAEGSFVKHNNEKCRIGITSQNCIDTNGAGDGYAAGFLYGIAHNFSLQQCGLLGAKIAGEVVQVVGPRLEDYTWETLRKEL